MLDLDLLCSEHDENMLYVSFASWLCLEKVTYQEFQKLAKWANCYNYVLPNDREIDSDLLDLLFNLHRNNLFVLALLRSHLEANLSAFQQRLLLERLRKQGTEDGKIAQKPWYTGASTLESIDYEQ